MKPNRARILALLVLAALPGCGDDGGTSPQGLAVVWGTVTLIETSPPQPVTTAEVILVDPADFTVKAGPTRVDSSGRYAFKDVPAGTYAALIVNSGYFLFDRTHAIFEVGEHDSLRQDFRVIESELIPTSGGFKVQGRVRDRRTGEPVAGVYVESPFSGFPGERLRGLTLPDQDITDEAGRFALESIPEIIDERGNVVGLFGVVAAKEGYGLYGSGLLPLPSGSDSTLIWNITLDSLGATGILRGRVLFRGEPLVGIGVALDYAGHLPGFDDARSKSMVPVLGKATVTDSVGAYDFNGLDPGFYTVEAAYRPDDGYTNPIIDGQQAELDEGDSIVFADIELLQGIHAVYPEGGERVESREMAFSWTPAADVDRYRLWISSAHTFNVSRVVRDSTRLVLALPGAETGEEAHIRWYVDGFRGDTLIAKSEEIATFTFVVADSDSTASGALSKKIFPDETHVRALEP